MSLLAELIEREFHYTDEKKVEHKLQDPDPTLPIQNVLEHYGQLYPMLTTASFVDKGIVQGKHIIAFQTSSKSKG